MIRILGLAILLLAACEGDLFETSHGLVDDGNEALESGSVEAAIAAYQAAAEELPAGGALSYDLGLALSEAGQHDEATQELLKAVDVSERALLQKVYAALGLAYSRWARAIEKGTVAAGTAPTPDPNDPGAEPAVAPEELDPAARALPKWEKAVSHLEEALLLDPADAASLRNLEVALRRVDPPCRARDDEHEPNQSHAAAAAIEVTAGEEGEGELQSGAAPAPEPTGDRLSWKRQLYSCPDDVDWYQLELGPGDRLEATLEISGAGKLALELVAPDGERQLQPAPDADPGARASAVQLTVGEPGGVYFLRVRNLDYDEVSYSLEVVVRPPCRANEDQFEENDRAGQAKMLTPGQLQGLKICPEDDDWYRVTLAEGESLFTYASLAPDPDEEDEAEEDEGPPPLQVEIVDAQGRTLGKGAPSGQARVASVLTPGEGEYRVRVSGEGELEARYDLLVKVIPPCPEGDDEHEDNDQFWAATDLDKILEEQAQAAQQQGGGQPGPIFMRICAGDRDWFTISSDPEQPTIVSSVFEHEKGDLEMVLYDDKGREEIHRSDTSSAETNGEAIAIPKTETEDDPNNPGGMDAAPAPAEKFGLLIRGKAGAENFYLLSVQRGGGGGGGGEDNEPQDQDQDQEDQDPQDQDQDQDQQQPEDQQQQPPKPDKPEPSTLEAMLDELDHNPKNLEAERAKALPLANTPPEKDW